MNRNKINEIVYDQTMYHGGKWMHFLSLSALVELIEDIIKSNTTTDYVKLNPFYINYKVKKQLEYDDYMFYMECRDDFNKEDESNHIEACIGKAFDQMTSWEIKCGGILYPLCKKGDVENYEKNTNL